MTNISLVDCNIHISATISYGKGIVPYSFCLTNDADISLHVSRFNYHCFSVNVKIIFRTYENVQKQQQKHNISTKYLRLINVHFMACTFLHTEIKAAF